MPCDPRIYVDSTVIATDSPSPIYLEGMMKRYDELHWESSAEYITGKISVAIYYTSLVQQVTAEFEKIPIFNLIGSVGGQLGRLKYQS